MTQSAMSQHLAALEAETGEALFTRNPRRMVPTERGKELYSLPPNNLAVYVHIRTTSGLIKNPPVFCLN